jgi:ABC-type transporter Mla subunit MlaD
MKPNLLNVLKTIFWPEEPISWFFYLLIGAIFWVATIVTITQYRKRKKELDELQNVLNGFSKIQTDDEIFNLEKDVNHFQIMKDSWTEFAGTLLISEDKKVFAKSSFHDFFHLDSLEPHSFLTPRVANSIPSTLTILGILGTFVSLVIGLQGLNINDSSQLQKGVGQLISSVNTAYVKSIWGVAGSVIFLFIDRSTSDKLRYQIEKIATHFDRLFSQKSSESLLTQILIGQEKQVATLKFFSTDLSNTISESIKDMKNKVVESIDRQSEGHKNAIEETVGDQITSAVSAGLNSVLKELGDMTTSLKSVTERMETFSDSANEMTTKLQTVTGDLEKSISSVKETLTSLGETVYAAKQAAENSRETIKQLVQEQKGSMDIVGRFDNVATKISDSILLLEKSQKEADNAASKIADTVKNLDENLKDFTGRFDAVNTTLGQTATDFAMRVREEIHAYCAKIDTSLAGATASLSTAVREIEGVLPTASSSLSDSLKSMEDALKRLETAMIRIKPDEGALREVSSLLSALKAWEIAQLKGDGK